MNQQDVMLVIKIRENKHYLILFGNVHLEN